jgi:fluoroacetyl-CoA thioesterase
MKIIFQRGDVKQFKTVVRPEDVAMFESGVVHNLYSTFALARDAEWCTRLFVLEMKDDDEEGIGTFVHVNHVSPAKLHTEISFTGVIDEIHGNAINCSFEARAGDRLVATGKTGQKILKKSKLEQLFNRL